jgi:hypothetical protein
MKPEALVATTLPHQLRPEDVHTVPRQHHLAIEGNIRVSQIHREEGVVVLDR